MTQTDRERALESEIADLERQQREATGWGAAVGARHEMLKGLYSERAALAAPSPAPAPDKREDVWIDNEALEFAQEAFKTFGLSSDQILEYSRPIAELLRMTLVKAAALRRAAGTDVTDAEVEAFCVAMGCTGNHNYTRSVKRAPGRSKGEGGMLTEEQFNLLTAKDRDARAQIAELTRERDEARAQFYEAVHAGNAAQDSLCRKIAGLERDRDEARARPTSFWAQLAKENAEGVHKLSAQLAELERERDALLEQIALCSESTMAKDNQEIMRINNELLAERDALRERLAEAETALREYAKDFLGFWQMHHR